MCAGPRAHRRSAADADAGRARLLVFEGHLQQIRAWLFQPRPGV